MKKLHRISEVAEMLGISTETIRYYENMGVIKPVRDEKNGYRYYGGWDIHMLARARLYRMYGFSLEETAKLLEEKDVQGVVSKLSNQEQKIEQDIVRMINLLGRIREEKSNMDSIAGDMGQYHIEKSPAMYRIHMQEEYTAINEKALREQVKQWAYNAPFLFSSAVFRLEDIKQGKKTFSFGFGIDEEYGKFLNIGDSPYIQYYPSKLSVHTMVPSRSGIHLDTDLLSEAFDWMSDHNLDIGGDILTRVVLMLRPEGEYFNWHQVWIPIENFGLDSNLHTV